MSGAKLRLPGNLLPGSFTVDSTAGSCQNHAKHVANIKKAARCAGRLFINLIATLFCVVFVSTRHWCISLVFGYQ